MTEWLAAQPTGTANLVTAADVFVYLGDLEPVFAASARALAGGGLFAFSVQKAEVADFMVGDDMRYAHIATYLRKLASLHGFAVLSLEEASTRKDRSQPVPGLVAVMARA